MRYKLLGRSGLRVSELCLGTMTFGEEWGWGSTREDSKKVFDTFANAGGNFIDTANKYTDGTSEKLVGEFINKDRDFFVLATKYTLYTNKCDVNSSGNHRKNMVRSLEDSLRRLRTDYVDLFWVHAWDFTTHAEEVLRALDDLIASGKIHYVGISNTPAWVISKANTIADLRGWNPFVAMQIEYNLTERSAERELIPMAKALDIGVCPWGLLAAGVLSGKYGKKSKAEKGLRLEGRSINPAHLKIADVVGKVAKEVGCTPSQVAINWVKNKCGVISPVVGARTAEQLEDNLNAVKHSLTPAQMDKLDKVSAIELGYPHDFLQKDVVREMIYGANHKLLDCHRC